MKKAVEKGTVIRLEDAYFCLNCEAVTNYVDNCPLCGERQLWALESWLGRVTSPENSRYKKSDLREYGEVTSVKMATRHRGEMLYKTLLAWRKKLSFAG